MHVNVTVTKGKCQGGIHEVGQAITVGWTTPEGICLGAWNAISPYVFTLRCGGNFPWEKQPGFTTIHCPDPKGITFELRPVEE